MKLQVHALRFCEDDEERAKKQPINSNPAVIDISADAEVVIRTTKNVINVTINGEPQMPMTLGFWEYTAVCLVIDEIPTIKSVIFQDSTQRYGDKEAVAMMEDGSKEFVFAWFRDELSFREDELVGLTVEEARDLRQKRDIQYLQS